MAQMCIADIAEGLHPFKKCGTVEPVCNHVRLNRLGERRPSGARFELFGSIEKDRPAAAAPINAGLEQAAHFGTESAFGGGLPGDAVFVRAQLSAPFRLSLHHPALRRRIAVLRQVEYFLPSDHTRILSGPQPWDTRRQPRLACAGPNPTVIACPAPAKLVQ